MKSIATLLLYVPLYSRKGRIHAFAEAFVFDQGTQLQIRPPSTPVTFFFYLRFFQKVSGMFQIMSGNVSGVSRRMKFCSWLKKRDLKKVGGGRMGDAPSLGVGGRVWSCIPKWNFTSEGRRSIKMKMLENSFFEKLLYSSNQLRKKTQSTKLWSIKYCLN